MNISKELEDAKRKRAELVDRINQLEQEKQTLLQEVLRTDGEVRILEKLSKGEE